MAHRSNGAAENLLLGGFLVSAIVSGYGLVMNHSAIAFAGSIGLSGSVYGWTRQRKIEQGNQAESDLRKTRYELENARQDVSSLLQNKVQLESHSQRLQADLTALQSVLSEMQVIKAERDSLLSIRSQFEQLQIEYKRLDAEQSQDNLDLEALKVQHAALKTQLANTLKESESLRSDAQRMSAEKQALLNENNQLKARFDSADELAQLKAGQEVARLKESIAQLQQTYDQKMSEYVRLAQSFNSLKSEDDLVLSELRQKFAYLSGEGFQEVEQTFNAELSDRDRMLLAASAKIAELENPHYFDDFGDFVRPNRLIKLLWESEERICLDASEIVPYSDNSGFDVYFSLRDRRARGQATIDALNDRGNEFSVLCGCVKDVKFEYDRLNPHRIKAAFTLRKPEKSTPKTTIDKLWISSDQFANKTVRLLKKPMTRVMGATGSGKGIFANLLLAVEANQSTPSAVRLHDPMDGSSADYWQIAKTSKGKSATKKAVQIFAKEFDQRLENGVSSPNVLDIFDEIDIVADSDSSINKAFLNAAKGMRHCGMRAVIIGQSPSVGKKGFEWADMDNFNAVYFGSSIVTAIEKTPSLEIQSQKLKETYQKLSDYCDKQNDELGLDGFSDWNAYRFGLIVTQGKATFFELPNADSIPCDWAKLSAEVPTIEPSNDVAKVDSIESSECQHSHSKLTKSVKDSSGIVIKQYRKCKDCGENFTVSL